MRNDWYFMAHTVSQLASRLCITCRNAEAQRDYAP
jgi:hypothetical protein